MAVSPKPVALVDVVGRFSYGSADYYAVPLRALVKVTGPEPFAVFPTAPTVVATHACHTSTLWKKGFRRLSAKGLRSHAHERHDARQYDTLPGWQASPLPLPPLIGLPSFQRFAALHGFLESFRIFIHCNKSI